MDCEDVDIFTLDYRIAVMQGGFSPKREIVAFLAII
jgi:hypothetical protein